MKRTFMAAVAAIFLGAGSSTASAIAAFAYGVSGSGIYQFTSPDASAAVPGGCSRSDPTSIACLYGLVFVNYQGALLLKTTSSADGTYAYGSGLESLSLVSQFVGWSFTGDFDYVLGDQLQIDDTPFGELDLGLLPDAYVTIVNGQVSDIHATFTNEMAQWTFGALGLRYTDMPLPVPNRDGWVVLAALTAVPEPAPAQLLLAALALAALTHVSRTGRMRSHRETRWLHARPRR